MVEGRVGGDTGSSVVELLESLLKVSEGALYRKHDVIDAGGDGCDVGVLQIGWVGMKTDPGDARLAGKLNCVGEVWALNNAFTREHQDRTGLGSWGLQSPGEMSDVVQQFLSRETSCWDWGTGPNSAPVSLLNSHLHG
jgi:hypothetical protein